MSLYADDSGLIGSTESSVARASTQEDLNLISLWACEWNLEFNIQKCKSIHFGRKNIRWQYHMIGGDGSRQLIDSLADGRDLGIVVDEELKFTKHAQTVVPKASQTLGLIMCTLHSRSSKVMTKLYKGLVQLGRIYDVCCTTPEQGWSAKNRTCPKTGNKSCLQM